MTSFSSDIIAIVQAVAWDTPPQRRRLNLATFGGVYDSSPDTISVAAHGTNPRGIFFKPDGTKMYEVGDSADLIYESDLSVPWDISTRTLVQSVAAQDANVTGLFFSTDGTKMYEAGNTGNLIYESDLSTPWDISTRVFAQSIASYVGIPRGIFFNPEGTKMYEVDQGTALIYEFDLSTPWDISTRSFLQSKATNDTVPQCIYIKPDGSKLYEVNQGFGLIYESDLSVPWDITTATLVRKTIAKDSAPVGIFFKPDGTRMYQSGGTTDAIFELRLFQPWNTDATTFNSSVPTQASSTQTLFISPDGTRMYEATSGTDLIYQFRLSVPWDITTREFLQSVATQDAITTGVFFKPDGTKMYEIGQNSDLIYESDLSVPWDISTRVFLQSIATQDATPSGLYIRDDGAKLYEIGATADLIYESDLSTPWDISTAVFSQSIAAQETAPTGIFFSPDGSKMYEAGNANDEIYESRLPTPWDISTRVFVKSTPSFGSVPRGLFFSSDGLRMYEIASFESLIFQVDLPNAWGIHYATAHYQGRILNNAIFETEIGVAFWGGAKFAPEFGYMDVGVADQDEALIDFAKNVTLANVYFFRVRGDGTVSPLAITKTSEIGFEGESVIRMRLVSQIGDAFELPINEHFYDSTNPDLDGRPFPILWGPGSTGDINEARQMAPCLLVETGSTPTYHFTDLDVIDLSDADQAPMDVGIGLDLAQFSIVDNGFALDASAEGAVTFYQPTDGGVVDPVDGTRLEGLFRFIRLAAQRVGVYDNIYIPEIFGLDATLPKDDFPQYQTSDVVRFRDFVAEIFNSFAGYLYADFNGVIRVGQLVPPEQRESVFLFTDLNTTGEIRVEDDRAPNLSDRIQYGTNWGALSESDLGLALADNEIRRARTTTHYEKKTGEEVLEFYKSAKSAPALKWAGRYALSATQSIAAQGSFRGVFLKPDGTAMYEINITDNRVYQSELSIPWDLTSASVVGSKATQGTLTTGIFFKDDGTKFYELSDGTNFIYEFDLSTPWDISTAVFVHSKATQDASPRDLFFGADGAKLYEIGFNSDLIYESDLSTPWDISTAVFLQSVATQSTSPRCIFFKPDGTKMYETDAGTALIYESDLSTPWDISTAVLLQSASSPISDAEGLFFKPDGSRLYTGGSTPSDLIYQETLSTPWDITSGPAVGAFPLDELNRWWMQLYNQRRRFYTWEAELTEETAAISVGDVVTLQSDMFEMLAEPINLFVRKLRYDFLGNLLTIEGWGGEAGGPYVSDTAQEVFDPFAEDFTDLLGTLDERITFTRASSKWIWDCTATLVEVPSGAAAAHAYCDHYIETHASSTTSMSVGFGTKTFADDVERDVGSPLRVSYDADNWMLGEVTASDGINTTIAVLRKAGSGTYANWHVMMPIGFPIEAQRTNAVRNPRFVGAAAGSPGTSPSQAFLTTTGGVFTRTIEEVGQANGYDFMRVRFVATGAGTALFSFLNSNVQVASSGQLWAAKALIALSGGSLANATPQLIIIEGTAAGVYVNGNSVDCDIDSKMRLYHITRTLDGGVSTERVYAGFRVVFSGAGDLTYTIAIPQLENAAFTTGTILPPAATIATSTRARDVPTITDLSSIGFEGVTEMTILLRTYLPEDRTVDGSALQIDDGTANNRVSVPTGASAVVYNPFVIVGGVGQATLTQAANSARGLKRIAMRVKASDFAAVTTGNSVVKDLSGSVPPAPTTVRFGHITSFSNYWNAHILEAVLIPAGLTDNLLKSWVDK